MNIEELTQKYGPIPNNLDKAKLTALLKKRDNKYPLIQDLRAEVISFLREYDLGFVEDSISITNLAGNIETLKTVRIEDQLLLILVDDYLVFNKKNVSKHIASEIHKDLLSKGNRVIWVKKFEWENLNKRTVLKSLILHCLGKTPNKVYARSTICDVVANKDLREFFDRSSFYGYRNASSAVCLRDKKTGEVLQAMSFGHPYYGKSKYGDHSVECIRSAGKPNTVIAGGMTKLMKFYVEEFKNDFDTIIYYVDDAHHQSGSMEALGFEFSHFAGSAVHNVWQYTGAMLMRTPALHKEIMYLQSVGEILGVPDVGNSTYVLKKGKELGHTNE